MSDTTTVGTEGWFGTVTDRIASVATMGWFLEVAESAGLLALSRKSLVVTGQNDGAVSIATQNDGAVSIATQNDGSLTVRSRIN